METMQTFGIQFTTRKSKVKKTDKSLIIFARITVNGSRAEISLKQHLAPKDWDSRKGAAKGKHQEIKKLNQFLDQVKTKLTNIYRELIIDGELPTATLIKNQFLGVDDQDKTLLAVFDYHKKISTDELSENTLKHYDTTRKYVKEFIQYNFHTSDVYLRKLSYRFITDFEYFLRNRKPTDHIKPMSNNGVMKHIERLRKIARLARKLGWFNKNPFENYQIRFKSFNRDFLEPDELELLESSRFKTQRLEYVKDLFIFSCYTGLAYIDMTLLAPDQIHQGINGDHWIISTRKKTNTPLRIPILPKALEIIEKYHKHPRSQAKGTVFPIISNQKLNNYLKEIGDLLNIRKNLTFHLARHTFATTVTLSNGVPIESVSKMLGHTSLKTTQIYARIVDSKLSEDMQTLKSKLKKISSSQQKQNEKKRNIL